MFYSAENAHAYMILDHVASGSFVLREMFIASSIIGYWQYKLMQGVPAVCKTAVPGRHVNVVIISFDPNKNYETYESSEIR